MNRQTEIENIIRTLWNIDDVTIDAESKNAIKKALQSLQDVRMALKKENDNFKNVRGISSSRKAIKSSLDDRLIPYLEEFEEGYANAQVVAPGDEMDIPSRQETFSEIFKNDYNLSDEDINKLKDAVMDIWEASAGD